MKHENELPKTANQTYLTKPNVTMELRNKNRTHDTKKWKFTKTVKQARTNNTCSGKNILEVSINYSLKNLCSVPITNLQVN